MSSEAAVFGASNFTAFTQPESDAPTARFLVLQHERRRRIALGPREVVGRSRIHRFPFGDDWRRSLLSPKLDCSCTPNVLTYRLHSKEFVMTAAARTARLGLRTTPQQEAVLRRAAEVSHKSMTDFILDSAYQVAEQTLLDQRLFMLTGAQAGALLDLLDRPAKNNAGLKDLFSRRAPWSK